MSVNWGLEERSSNSQPRDCSATVYFLLYFLLRKTLFCSLNGNVLFKSGNDFYTLKSRSAIILQKCYPSPYPIRSLDLSSIIELIYVSLFILFYFILAAPYSMWDLSSPTRDWTCTPCIGSVEWKSPGVDLYIISCLNLVVKIWHETPIVELEQIALGVYVCAVLSELFLYWSFLSSTKPQTV